MSQSKYDNSQERTSTTLSVTAVFNYANMYPVNKNELIRFLGTLLIILSEFVWGQGSNFPNSASASKTQMIATKIKIPPPLPNKNFVPRLNLWNILNSSDPGKLILVSAPAGSGKTTTISQWLHHQQISAAWISLDENDNEPSHFWQQMSTACQIAWPDINFSKNPSSSENEKTSFKNLREMLVNHLIINQNDFYIVLDDYHLINEPTIHKSLAIFLKQIPITVHLILITRTDPPLPLPHLRVRGELAEIRTDDLRFSKEETTLFLNQVMALKLSTEDIITLESRTEGWIAGLQLAALAILANDRKPNSINRQHYIQTFAGNQRHVADFLLEEILHQQSKEWQAFLLQTSVLDWLSVPLCNAVTGQNNAYQQLDAIERANLFLQPLDETRQRYRYHHLFSTLLRTHLQKTYAPDKVSELHHRAAEWLLTNQHETDALKHALQAPDYDLAGPIFWRVAPTALLRGELLTVRHWLEQIPEIERKKHLAFAHVNAWVLLLSGEIDQAESWLRISEEIDTTHVDPMMQQQIAANSLAMRSLLTAYRGHFHETLQFGETALKKFGPDNQAVRSIITLVMGDAHRWDGELDSARDLYEQTATNSLQAQNYNVLLQAYRSLVSIAFINGHLHQVDNYLNRVDILFSQQKMTPWLPALGPIFNAKSKLAYERNQLSEALDEWKKGRDYCEELSQTVSLVGTYLNGARIQQANRESQAAQSFLDKARYYIPHNSHPYSWIVLDRHQVALWIQINDYANLQYWLETNTIPEHFMTYAKYFSQHTRARVLVALAQSEPGMLHQAHPLLTALAETAHTNGWLGEQLALLLLQAKVDYLSNDMDQAQAALTTALTIGKIQGHIRAFIDEGPIIAELLQKRKTKDRYIRSLLAHFEEQLSLHEPFLSDPLSPRELEVLQLIAEGYVNQEIAGILGIAISTVKTHINHIFSKLNVQTRAQAIVIGQKLNLL